MEYSIRIDRGVVYGPSTTAPSSPRPPCIPAWRLHAGRQDLPHSIPTPGTARTSCPEPWLAKKSPRRKPTEKSEFPSLGRSFNFHGIQRARRGLLALPAPRDASMSGTLEPLTKGHNHFKPK